MSSQDAAVRHQPVVPDKVPTGEYPLIDNDPHISRVLRYTRLEDWAYGTAAGATSPLLLLYWEKVSPSFVGKGGFAPILRLSGVIGISGAFILAYTRSCMRFYGATENRREVEMDMREMTDKVKRGEPLYGKSTLTEYMQGVAHRNSRYSATFSHVILWPNFVNHPYHGVDTAKYYRQAELELEQEKSGR